ncbi:glycosyltransferase [Candidatus Falkowbacteria bacterium]|nr:glycosyltransferase [Candidatus Falkowbacteria bacterium]
MQQIDVIMFSMSHYTDWQAGRVNRNYHILQALERDERVRKIVSIDFLPFNFKKFLKVYLENIIWPMPDLQLVYGDLTSACHQVNSKLFVYSTVDSLFSQAKVIKELRRIVKALQLQNIVLWSYNPLYSVSLEELGQQLLGHKLFVFDAVDNWLEHSAFRRYRARLRQGYDLICRDADLVFTVSDYLRRTIFPNCRKGYWVPNGIDLDHFTLQAGDAPPTAFKHIPRPIIGYHGIIQDRFDLALTKYLAEKNPDKSIVLLGSNAWPVYEKILRRELAHYRNIYLLPFVPYQELPQYLRHIDVGIIPHKVTELTKSMNPMKLYEYSACGKPVVTTSIAGAETFQNILYVAQSYQEFNDKIQLALREDDARLARTRREVVADDSWDGRVQLMLKYTFELLPTEL